MNREIAVLIIFISACSSKAEKNLPPTELVGETEEISPTVRPIEFDFEPLDVIEPKPYRFGDGELKPISDVYVNVGEVRFEVDVSTLSLPKLDAWFRKNGWVGKILFDRSVLRYDSDEAGSYSYVSIHTTGDPSKVQITVTNNEESNDIALGAFADELRGACDLYGLVDGFCIDEKDRMWIYPHKKMPDEIVISRPFYYEEFENLVVKTAQANVIDGAVVLPPFESHHLARIDTYRFGRAICGLNRPEEALHAKSCQYLKEEMASCENSLNCASHGRCGETDSTWCKVRNQKDCERSWNCQTNAKCTLKGSRCDGTPKRKHCAQSKLCEWWGSCDVGTSGCEPSKQTHCQKSRYCEEAGGCRFSIRKGIGICEVGSKADCLQSTFCEKYGSCDQTEDVDFTVGKAQVCRKLR